MTADYVKRTVAVVAFATAIGLFSTIAAVAAVNVIPLKWDGTMCERGPCGAAWVSLTPRPAVHVAAVARPRT